MLITLLALTAALIYALTLGWKHVDTDSGEGATNA